MRIHRINKLIIILLILGFNSSCAKKAYYYYKIDNIDAHFFNIESQDDSFTELNCCDSIKQNTSSYVHIDPQISLYYKEKNKNFSPSQRGEKCSEEKIITMQIALKGDKYFIDIDTLMGPLDFSTNYSILNSTPGISMVKFPDSTSYFLNLNDFIQSFNSCDERVKYDYNIIVGLRLLFNTNNIPKGDYVIHIDVVFDSGRKLNLNKKLVIY